MALRFILAASMLAMTVSAQYGGYGHGYTEESYAHPKYNFEYSVNDPHTYDIKSQKESRDGDHVYGVYELYEPDGTRRVVEYADTGYGFQATVHRQPTKYGPAYNKY